MSRKQKFYVVWEGNRPGIYESWADCKAQIMGYPNARYKAFKSRTEAEEAYTDSFTDHMAQSTGKKTVIPNNYHLDGVIMESLSVDAACSGNPGVLEYQGVDTKTKMVLFRQGPFQKGTNNIGEFLALVHGLALLKKEGKHRYPIYSDSRTAMAWVRNKKVNTKLKRSHVNEPLFQLVDRALSWLKTQSYENPILKWETDKWGEIPADFGRK